MDQLSIKEKLQLSLEERQTALENESDWHDKDNVQKSIKNAIRTDMPYSARHMPWYLDKNNLSDEEFYYIKHCNAICDNRRVGVYSNAHRKWFNHFIRMI